MPLPAGTTSPLEQVLQEIIQTAYAARTRGSAALADLNGNVDAYWIFSFIDAVNMFMAGLNARSATPGLNAFATAQIPGYAGTMTTDIAAAVAAAQTCLDWVVTNFPKDSTNQFILAMSLSVNGTRVARVFTSTQTAGLRTAVQNLINTLA
jgi:hypothetical protein